MMPPTKRMSVGVIGAWKKTGAVVAKDREDASAVTTTGVVAAASAVEAVTTTDTTMSTSPRGCGCRGTYQTTILLSHLQYARRRQPPPPTPRLEGRISGRAAEAHSGGAETLPPSGGQHHGDGRGRSTQERES